MKDWRVIVMEGLCKLNYATQLLDCERFEPRIIRLVQIALATDKLGMLRV